MSLQSLKVKIFADGADLDSMIKAYRTQPFIKGFTTNPSLMRQAGVSDYEGFARKVLDAIPDRPISLEVFSDEFEEMRAQALKIASWGSNVYVKIPVTNTRKQSSLPLIRGLASEGVKLNVTAILTLAQVRDVVANLNPKVPSYVSVFAGRIADTGVDPMPVMAASVSLVAMNPMAEVIWASSRELLNIYQADAVGCQVITASADVLKKVSLIGRDLDEYSLDTVKTFYADATKAGFKI
jgi:transaldolase